MVKRRRKRFVDDDKFCSKTEARVLSRDGLGAHLLSERPFEFISPFSSTDFIIQYLLDALSIQ